MGTEIQNFAAELRALKERSGLSYGTLARKLHLSTSTVHRYCNGDAVPHDYAPVERFARVCRASAAELVALHRTWILADEAKRRAGRKAQDGAAATEAGGPVPAAGKRSGPQGGPAADSAGTSDTGTDVTAEARPEGGPDVGSEAEAERPAAPSPGLPADPAPGHGTAPATEPPPAPAPGTPAGAASPARHEVTPGTAPALTPAPRRRVGGRTKAFLAAAAVVALTVPAALAVHRAGKQDTAGGVSTERPAAASASGGSSGLSPAPGRPTGTPSTPGTPSAAPSAPAAATATRGSGGPERNTGTGNTGSGDAGTEGAGTPVNATISSYNWEAPCGQYYLLDREPDDVPPPPAPQDTRSWAKALGGVDGGDMKLELTLQGRSQEAVVLNGLHVRVLGREPALAWSAYSMGNGCGGGITPQTFAIDLDDGRPRSKPVAGEDAGTVVPAKDFPYRVSSTDVEVFHLDAHVEGHDVTWYLELEWTSGGRSGTLRIDDHGKPFRTSALAARPEYLYRADTAQWVDAGL